MSGLTKEMKNDRVLTLTKAYVTVRKNVTARQVCEFINNNNFGVNVTYQEIVTLLKNNVFKKHKRSRGCLKNCYDFNKDKGYRVYSIHEE